MRNSNPYKNKNNNAPDCDCAYHAKYHLKNFWKKFNIRTKSNYIVINNIVTFLALMP